MKKIIELPCWIGDKVYFPHFEQYNWGEISSVEFYGKSGEPYFNYETGTFGPDGYEGWGEGYFLLSDIGKTAFLTQEEAEATEQYQKEKAEYEKYNKSLYEEYNRSLYEEIKTGLEQAIEYEKKGGNNSGEHKV